MFSGFLQAYMLQVSAAILAFVVMGFGVHNTVVLCSLVKEFSNEYKRDSVSAVQLT